MAKSTRQKAHRPPRRQSIVPSSPLPPDLQEAWLPPELNKFARARFLKEVLLPWSEDLKRLRLPKTLPRKKIDWGRVFRLLYEAWLQEQRQPNRHAPLKQTSGNLNAFIKAASRLSSDPNIWPSYREKLQSLASEAEKHQTVFLALYLGERRRGAIKRGQRTLGDLNALLTEIHDELCRATGSPHWDFLLKLLKPVLPRTFPSNAKIHNLRSRVRQPQKQRRASLR